MDLVGFSKFYYVLTSFPKFYYHLRKKKTGKSGGHFGGFRDYLGGVRGSGWECLGVIWGVSGGKIGGKSKTQTEKK